MSNEVRKEYSNAEITVIWKPKLCIHAKECVSRLPEVYDPEKRPWIQPKNASAAALKEQIDACPSGALSYKMEGEAAPEAQSMETKVEVLENGPLLVYGTLKVTDAAGATETKNRTTAFCRCGQSQNKPYCDGAHVEADFRG